jgi:hypothetical protein
MRKLTSINFRDAHGNSLPYTGRFSGASLFIVGGGPSISALDCTTFARRGVVTLAINNVAANIIRPTFWTAGDAPDRFALSIWRDPGVVKFVPETRMRESLAEEKDGKYVKIPLTPSRMPNVVSFPLVSVFNPETWLNEPFVAWGNQGTVTGPDGIQGRRTSFLIALKLAYTLGFRQVFLVGCDFKSTVEKPYGFPEAKPQKLVDSSNRDFEAIFTRLNLMRESFAAADFHVKTCVPNTEAPLDYVPFEEALEQCLNYTPQEVRTEGMYYAKQEVPKGTPQRVIRTAAPTAATPNKIYRKRVK